MKEISKIKIGKIYSGSHVISTLLASGFMKYARKGWFEILKMFPTQEQFVELRRERFTSTAEDLVGDAFSAFEELRDELQNWYDNLPEGFQNGDKGDALQEAISNLEGTPSSAPDLEDWMKEIKVCHVPAEDVNSRADRCSEAASMLRSVIRVFEEEADKVEKTDKEKAQALREMANELDSAASEAEYTEFPGMY